MAEPLTPSNCDCRGLPFMPLEVSRLLDSDLVALSTGDEFKAALILWAKSWSQVPAASIPDDDRILAKWTGNGLAQWSDLRDMALRGWVKCDDGRLYHPVVADLAISAHAKRKVQSDKANGRWERVRSAKKSVGNAAASKTDTGASKNDAAAMQVKGTVEVEEEISDANASSGVSAEPNPPSVKPDPVIVSGLGELLAGGVTHLRLAGNVQKAFDDWNELAKRLGLPEARKLDEPRKRAIRSRLADGGVEAWAQALQAVERSKHCRGDNDRGWRADLDFVCQPKSWRRLLEGSYGHDAIPQGTALTASSTSWRGPSALRAAIVERMKEPWALSWTDRSEWLDLPSPTLIAGSKIAADRIAEHVGDILRQHGVTIEHKRGAA